jgi:phage gp46-like protein
MSVYDVTTPEILDDPQGATLPKLALALLGTDRRCSDSELPPTDDDPRGWHADPEMGSRLWLLYRAPLTEASRALAEAYALEALAPLQRAGIVERITARATIADGAIALDVDLYRPGESAITARWSSLWGAA